MLARAGAVGVVLGAALSLAACGRSEDGAQPLPPVTSVASETASPSPTEQATPKVPTKQPSSPPSASPSASPSVSIKPGVDISEEEAASAVAVVERFWSTADAAAGGQPLAQLEVLYLGECATCVSIHDQIAEAKAQGQRVVGNEHKVVESRVDRAVSETAVVAVGVRSTSGRLVDEQGETVDTFSGGTVSDYVFSLQRNGPTWKVFNILALGPR